MNFHAQCIRSIRYSSTTNHFLATADTTVSLFAESSTAKRILLVFQWRLVKYFGFRRFHGRIKTMGCHVWTNTLGFAESRIVEWILHEITNTMLQHQSLRCMTHRASCKFYLFLSEVEHELQNQPMCVTTKVRQLDEKRKAHDRTCDSMCEGRIVSADLYLTSLKKTYLLLQSY